MRNVTITLEEEVVYARDATCRFLLTEDLQDQQVLGDKALGEILVVSPFRHEPGDILGRM